MFHHAKQDRLDRQLARPARLEALASCRLAGPLGVVAQGARSLLGRGMPAPFATDRRGGAMQGPGHRTQTLPLLGQHHDYRPLFSRQLFEVLAHHNTYKCSGVAFDSRLRHDLMDIQIDINQFDNIAERLFLFTCDRLQELSTQLRNAVNKSI